MATPKHIRKAPLDLMHQRQETIMPNYCVRLPRLFAQDHFDRCADHYAGFEYDLAESGSLWRLFTESREMVELILSDAQYYADPLGFDEHTAKHICPSAARAVAKLEKSLSAPAADPGTS